MIFKREQRTYPTVHWVGGRFGLNRGFCGHLITPNMAAKTDKELVNCKRCLAYMRIYGHMPVSEP